MNGHLRYYHTKNAPGWLHAVGLQSPEANTIKERNPSVLTETDVVNKTSGLRFSRATPVPASPTRQALPEETRFRQQQRIFQDKMNRFTVIKAWLTEQGVELSEKADVYLAETLFHGRVTSRIEDFRNKTVQPLIEKIGKSGFNFDQVAEVLHAQHAPERNAQLAKANPQQVDANGKPNGSGMSDEVAKKIMAQTSPELLALANELRSICDGTLDLQVQSGLLPKETAAAFRKAYAHYVPLRGGPQEDAAKTGTGKGLKVRHKEKRALGHGERSDGEWIVENILAMRERAIMAAEKNEVGKSLVLMAADVGRDDLMTIDKPKKRQVLMNQTSWQVFCKGQLLQSFDSREAAQTFRQLAPLTMKGTSPSDFTLESTSDPMVALMASPMLADNETVVYVAGHEVRTQINDDLLARAYANQGASALNDVLQAGAVLNRYLSAAYTGFNPAFLPKNIVRDFQTGVTVMLGEEGIGVASKAIRHYPARFMELFRYARTGKEGQWVKDYRADGGNTGAAYLPDLERLGEEVKTEYAAYLGVTANLKQGQYRNAGRAAWRKVFNATLKWLERANQASENAMRLAAYQAMIESGKSRKQSASLAKNVTVNFNRKGEFGRTANALWLFFNPNVQGPASLAHALFKGKHKYQAWSFIGAMGGIAYLTAMMAMGDDDKSYLEMSDYDRARNLLFKVGDGFFKLPVAYGLGFFTNLGRGFAEAQQNDDWGKLPWQIAASFVEEFTPFGASVAGKGPDSGQMIFGALPTAIQIAAAPAFNITTFGSELMPENKNDKFQPDREKMHRSTRGTLFDGLAGALKTAGMDVSPETLKHLWNAGTGGTGKFITDSASAIYLSSSGAELEVADMPIVRDFYKVPDIRGVRARYYEAREEVDRALADYERSRRSGQFDTMREVMNDQRELIVSARIARRWDKLIKSIRDREDAVRLSGKYTPAEERVILKQMEREEAEIYDRLIQRFNAQKQDMKARQEKKAA